MKSKIIMHKIDKTCKISFLLRTKFSCINHKFLFRMWWKNQISPSLELMLLSLKTQLIQLKRYVNYRPQFFFTSSSLLLVDCLVISGTVCSISHHAFLIYYYYSLVVNLVTCEDA